MDLDKMEAEWNEVLLQIIPYKETGTCVLKGIDDLYLILDEHITNTQAMSFSNFKGPFEQRIDNWNECLQTVSEVIDEWVGVQKNWLYLQPIFDSADINKQLPIEGKRFSTVDKHWRQTMTAASSGEVLAIKFCNNAQLLERYRESNKLLDMVQRGLSDYLQTKQAAFSRFYFLSDGDLLEILSETKDPRMVQPHLKKCFEGIKSVDFKDDLTIVAMTSSEKEHVIWNAPVDPKNKSIEVWMTELQVMMLATIRQQMILGIQDYYETKRTDWMQKWPGQVVINASQFQWTAECEEMINESGNEGVKAYYQQCIQQLADMVQLVRGGKLTKGLKTTIGALATMDVHARDVLKRMAEIGVSAVSDFEWMTQMRFYWEGDTSTTDWKGDLKVIMMTSKRAYGYEYLGNSFRLVITPLTDKCYLTLMGALQMILGGAPAGPAGTGKTETTKDLAKALAKQCVVFNCSDGLDYRAMGKFFKGLAGCGAWACFDEFNRIDIEVLSVIAQQVLTLQGAVQRGEKRIIFEETDIFVDPEFAVYITMNPGYAGRSALPDNLEALFRPVAMMVPNYALIGEIMMFSYGYLESQACAQKMVATFSLCAEQLSAQDHYDYGMRAVKTVITAAGNLKSASPDEQEQALLLRALQDVNVPKFLAHDLPLFDGILSDLFPGIERPPFDYGPLLNGIKLSCQRNNLQCLPIFMRKNIELYEMICVRHGLMVVGPTGGGKSSCIRTLKETLTFLTENGFEGERYEKVEVYHLNPKSIKMTQLYGAFDENTREWQDGILANLMRVAARKTSSDLQWMLFDGPVDAIWIENMNTVLDDNKKLCLTSGEIMALSDQQTMMFEPEDLAVASPATVSRCGMIYMEPTSLGYDPLVQSWLNTLPPGFGPEHRIKLQSLCDTYVGALPRRSPPTHRPPITTHQHPHNTTRHSPPTHPPIYPPPGSSRSASRCSTGS
jgi:dynein heavy chain, axonemal